MKLRNKPSRNAVGLITVPAGEMVTVIGKSFQMDGTIPFIKCQYRNVNGYINARYLKGMVLKVASRDSKRYPKKVILSNGKSAGKKVLICQQKSFGTFCKSHGCSIASTDFMLRLNGIEKSLDDIVSWAKKSVSGWTGSKLTIYGIEKAVNGITKKDVADWKPITGKDNEKVIDDIREALRNGCAVAIEQRSPIHTNTLIGYAPDGKVYKATNGKVVKTTIRKEVKAALHGSTSRKKQKCWWPRAAGYVICKK